MFQFTNKQLNNLARLFIASVAAIVGYIISYHFGPPLGIAYVCLLIGWFNT